jgi:pimeloyl-ACP methyl ester carboxylesterase
MVTDLHRLVTFAAPQERPLLLVGTSLGGLVARGFAHLHPQVIFLYKVAHPNSGSNAHYLRFREDFLLIGDEKFFGSVIRYKHS